MNARLLEDVLDKIEHARVLYHRLVLVVGPPRAGKTRAFREIAERTGAPLINVNLELSSRLLDLAEARRPMRIQPILEQVVAETASAVVLLDNIELLFDVALQQDPLRLLQGLARHRTVVAAWNGSIKDNHVFYAAPEHPEYRHYSVDGVLAVNAGMAAT